MTERPEGSILIEYGTAAHLSGHGSQPMVWENGKRSARWTRHGMSPEDAFSIARIDANDIASKYVGDWSIIVRERQ